jgi:GTP-binding protein
MSSAVAVQPVVAIVGRPNVGKSTLFNRLTRSRAALVADFPGLTRDRHYGRGRAGPIPYIVIDTGGFEPAAVDGMVKAMAAQAEQAIAEADVVILVLDARSGLTGQDARIAERLRARGGRVLLAVNKAEGLSSAAVAEFHELGMGEPLPVSAAHGDGIGDLMDLALAPWVPPEPEEDEDAAPTPKKAAPPVSDGAHVPGVQPRIRVAVVGRPNAGKSTLVNALLGEDRMIAADAPGTTRDAIETEFEFGGEPYLLVDTAGLRRKGKVFETIEKFSVVKTLQAIEQANVAVLMLDATAEVADQDAHIAGYILETGRALVVAVNKWDGISEYEKSRIRRELDRKLHFLRWASIQFISARAGTGLGVLMREVRAAHRAAYAKLPTPKLTRALREAVIKQAPPRAGRYRPKMRYAHQGGQNPPVVVIHGNAVDHVDANYRRYLEGWFREAFELRGTPLRIEFKVSRNPYVD